MRSSGLLLVSGIRGVLGVLMCPVLPIARAEKNTEAEIIHWGLYNDLMSPTHILQLYSACYIIPEQGTGL